MLKRRIARLLANGFAGVSPRISAKISATIWVGTHRYRRKNKEQVCWQDAERITLAVDDEKVAVYHWKNGTLDLKIKAPLILLIHGWNGRATQYFALIDRLISKNYRVISFDAPGHGDSSGNKTNLHQMLKIVKRLQKDYGEFDAIVGHSFGFIVAVNALSSGVNSKAMIGISSPSDFSLLLRSFSRHLGLNKKAELAFMDSLKHSYGIDDFDEISIHHLAKGFNVPCLLIHDEHDKQVPFEEAQKITRCWRGAVLYRPNGGGHSRILYQEDMLEKCIGFLDKDKLC